MIMHFHRLPHYYHHDLLVVCTSKNNAREDQSVSLCLTAHSSDFATIHHRFDRIQDRLHCLWRSYLLLVVCHSMLDECVKFQPV